LDGAGAGDEIARARVLVAVLEEGRAARRCRSGEFGQIPATRALRVENGIEPEVDLHGPHLSRAAMAASSRASSASSSRGGKVPGPPAFSPATSPAMPMSARPEAAANSASSLT